MATAVHDPDLRQRMQRIDALLQEVEQLGDPKAQMRVVEIVQMLLEFHGQGLKRMLECIAAAGESGQAIIDAMAADELIGSLLLLHDLHPRDLEQRVGDALDSVRPYLASHGGRVEFLGITQAGAVRLRLEGSCHGCPSSRATLKGSIEEAIYASAPEVTAIEVEGLVDEPAPAGPAGFVPLSQLNLNEANSRGFNEAEHPGFVGCGIPSNAKENV